MAHCTCAGDPEREPCRRCAARIDAAQDNAPDPHGWMVEQDRYERWLGEIAP